MGRSISESLGSAVNVPEPEMVQFVSALGCAILRRRRLDKIRAEKTGAGWRLRADQRAGSGLLLGGHRHPGWVGTGG